MVRLFRIILQLVVGVLLTLSLFGVLTAFLPLHIQFIPALLSGSVLAVILVVLLTLCFGRIYCSTVCPLGLWQDLVLRLSVWGRRGLARLRRALSATDKGNGAPKRVLWSPNKRVQFVLRLAVLAAVVLSAFTGVVRLVVYLDPYANYARMVAQLLHLSSVGALTAVAAVAFIVTTGCAWVGGRLYCNTLCPVGTVLGLLSHLSVLKVRIDADKCVRCGRCARSCKSACIDLSGTRPRVHTDLCVDCFDCLNQCKAGALTFGKRQRAWAVHHPASKETSAHSSDPILSTTDEADGVDTSRRRFLTAALTAAASVPLLKAQRVIYETTTGERWEKKIHTTMPDGSPAVSRFWAIMPPATVSRDRFLSHCVACQACIAQCPEHILKPAVREYGLEGFMAPTVSYEVGFCRPECNRCAEVCPTDAIRLLPLAQKRKDKLGWANFNSMHCVTQTDNVECGLCARRCPNKAITLIEKNGHKVPRVNVTLCTGCGACEHYCPSRPKAIYVEGLMY